MSIFSNLFQNSTLFRNTVLGGGILIPNGGTVFIPKVIIPDGGTPIGSNTGTGTGTGTGTEPNPDPNTTPFIERVQVLERIKSNAELDPSAKARILQLAATQTNLTAYDLRVMLATCLYPSAQGLPAPEGYEYFLTQIEKGKSVTVALSDARTFFNAAAAQTGNPGDPNAPDSQETLITQGTVFTLAIIVFAFLIIRK